VEAAVRRTHRTLAGLLRHEHAPLALAQRCSGVIAPAPLFSALFNYRHSPERDDGSAAGMWEGIELLRADERTNYPLGVSVDDLGEGFALTAQTLPEIGAERLCGYLQTATEDLVRALEIAPATAVRELAVLPEAERRQVLYDWNTTETEYPKEQCVHQLFEAQAHRTPDAVALVFEEQSLSYAELNIRANRLAHHLIDLGIRPDVRVAIGVERSLEMVVGLLAILKAGGAYVPLDPAYPEERLAFMLEDSAPLALLVHGATRERFAALAGDVPLVDLDADAAAWAELSATNPEPAALGLRPNHLAYVIYTSGSTGRPKGVMVEHGGVSAHCLEYRDRHGLGATDRVSLMAEISFDASVEQLFPAMIAGGQVILTKFDLEPSRFSRQLKAHAVTLVDISGVYWRSLVQNWLGQPDVTPSSTLRILIVGGDVMPVDVLPAWRQLPLSQTTRLFNVYGPTETTVAAAVFALPIDFKGPTIPIGRPIANKRIYLLDADGQPVPIGVAGEIHIGGAGVARGYLNRPELTTERFLTDPYSPEPNARMYRTGDLARWLPDGNLEFLGRSDFQVKIRGFRIELGEIEAALRACQGIHDAVVLAREDGPGEKRLVAYVTVAGRADTVAGDVDTTTLPATLKTQLQSSLPDYMVPAAFVVLDALPLTPNGKLDRKALPAPEADAYATGAYAPPEGQVEEALAALWSELLGIERVGRHDDFFALGGHSLLVLRLLSELDQAFGVRLPVGVVFLRPTLAGLADAVGDSRLAEEAAALVPLQPEGQDPPLFLLPGAIGSVLYLQPLAEALGEGRPVLALPTPGLDGRPTLESMTELAAHHLRTLRRRQPRGPYFLAGHSSGGRVAFEMAQQLERQGETVARLVILDTNAPDPGQDGPNRTEREVLADLVKVFEELGGVALGISPEAILSEPNAEDAYAKVMVAFQANGVLFSRSAAVAELKALAAVYRSALDAHQDLRIAQRLRAPIHLLLARDRGGSEAFVDQRPAWGWAEGTEQGVVVDEVPGTHITMMAPPHVAVLAARLAGILASADDSTDASAPAAPAAFQAEAASRR
jgi:amino acid adenylation domain-containing protein